ncbi:MAG: M15 family metallopeptidase, partial [Acidimicrobiales bacterium]
LGGRQIDIDPAWVEEHIVTADLPLLGPVRCHRSFVEIIRPVLQGLIDDGLEDVIDPSRFEGCWNPRFIGNSNRLSRHAWGAAADINFGNPLGDNPGSPIHPELLDRMAAAGVTSGHDWTIPDPGHFEYVGPSLTATE